MSYPDYTVKNGEAKYIDLLVKGILDRELEMEVCSGGDEPDYPRGRDYEEITSNIAIADETTIYVYEPGKKKHIAWIFLVHGNEDFEVVNDYTANELMEELMKPLNELADAEGH